MNVPGGDDKCKGLAKNFITLKHRFEFYSPEFSKGLAKNFITLKHGDSSDEEDWGKGLAKNFITLKLVNGVLYNTIE